MAEARRLPRQMIHCEVGSKPKDDNGYFEQMTKAVFRSGFNWGVIDAKWPGFTKAFEGFSVEAVARFDEADVERLVKDKGIVRNERKILATIANARGFFRTREEYGSFHAYLRAKSAKGEKDLARAVVKDFAYIGDSTIMFFLRSVGEEMPEMNRAWLEQHGRS